MLIPRVTSAHPHRTSTGFPASVRSVALVGLVAAALAVTGCASAGKDGSGSYAVDRPADFNEQDVSFLQEMIPRHERTVEFTETVVETEGVAPEVAALADRIGARHASELEQLNDWFTKSGGEELNSGTELDTDGAITEDDVSQLEGATGAEASRLFLEQMIEQHEGVTPVAEQEAEGGQSFGVVNFAEDLVEQQEEEITELEGLLAATPAG